MQLYSRDEQSGPFRALESLISAVYIGEFSPDSSRSGAWAGKAPAAIELPEVDPDVATEVATDVLAEQEQGLQGSEVTMTPGMPPRASSEDPFGPAAPASILVPSAPVADELSDTPGGDSTSSCSESDGESDEVEKAAEAEARFQGFRPALAAGGEALWRRPKIGTLHACRSGASGKLACGRPIEGFRLVESRPAVPVQRCKICFGTEDVGGSRLVQVPGTPAGGWPSVVGQPSSSSHLPREDVAVGNQMSQQWEALPSLAEDCA